MNSIAITEHRSYQRVAVAALLGGAAAGFLDEMSAFASILPHGGSVERITQYQASGLIGMSAFSGGIATAALGVAVHFSLTTLMAVIFIVLSNRYPRLRTHVWTSGIVYGIIIFIVMNYVAVPLSGAPHWKPPTGWGVVGALLPSCFYVGVPIASIARSVLLPTDSV
jgi:uncharacterized membrane protein YagU involved in acid resistance